MVPRVIDLSGKGHRSGSEVLYLLKMEVKQAQAEHEARIAKEGSDKASDL